MIKTIPVVALVPIKIDISKHRSYTFEVSGLVYEVKGENEEKAMQRAKQRRR